MFTAIVISIALLFAATITVDFATGLIKLWQDAGSKAQPRFEAKPAAQEQAITPEPGIISDPWLQPMQETAIALPAEHLIVKQHLLLAPTRVQVATLDWAERNLPPVQMFAVEMPCAIALAKSRLPKVTPVVEIATRQQLIDLGIRRCRKLASQLKVRRYNTMRLAELADALTGKISLTDLAA